MILELEEFEDFLREVREQRVMISTIETPLQDEKGNIKVGFLAVYTSKRNDNIIKYVDVVGTAKSEDKKEIDKMIEIRSSSITARKNEMMKKSVEFSKGLWSE